jgi:hypothetical protein
MDRSPKIANDFPCQFFFFLFFYAKKKKNEVVDAARAGRVAKGLRVAVRGPRTGASRTDAGGTAYALRRGHPRLFAKATASLVKKKKKIFFFSKKKKNYLRAKTLDQNFFMRL